MLSDTVLNNTAAVAAAATTAATAAPASATTVTSTHRGMAIPASAFGIVLGLAGLGNCWKAASVQWSVSPVVYQCVFAVATLIWALLVIGYGVKWLRHRDEALAELNHPIACCFIGLVPVATILVAVWLHEWMRPVGTILVVVGACAQLGFSTYRSGGLLRGGRAVNDTTAVMYLPTVAGNFVSAIGLSALGWTDLAKLFFGAGLFSWFALESVITFRLYFNEALPKGLRPTLGIQLAPPVVASVAYLGISGGSVDWIFYAFYGYALLQAAFLLRITRWLLEAGATPAFWAFSFGVTALGVACFKAASLAPASVFASLLLPVFVLVNLFIGVLIVMTVRLLVQGKLFRR